MRGLGIATLFRVLVADGLHPGVLHLLRSVGTSAESRHFLFSRKPSKIPHFSLFHLAFIQQLSTFLVKRPP